MIVRLAMLAAWAATAPLAAVSIARIATPALAAAPSSVPAAGDEYVDPRLGIRIAFPHGWSPIPMSVDERWKVAKYLSDKTHFWTEKGGGWTMEHKPTMEVVAFVAEAMKQKVKVEKKRDKDGEIDWRVFVENPYTDYKDFLTKRYRGGGWFISDEKETKVGDVAVTCYEIKVEKLSMDGPKRIFAWVYHVPDVDIVVQFEVLENAVDKLKNESLRCFRSFKTTPRSGGQLYEASTPGEEFLWSNQDKLTQEERTQKRQGMERRSHEKATKAAPDGWAAKRMGRFLVINHADEKYAKQVVEQAEAVWGWLDETFPFIGQGEYVRSPIIRICKDWQEMQAYERAGDYFSRNDLEIITCQDYGGKTGWAMENVNRRVMGIWFQDKDWDLGTAMPGWLGLGLSQFVGNLHAKNGKVDFGTDYWNRGEVQERMRKGQLTPVRTLMTMTQRDFMGDFWSKIAEGESLIQFFVTGAAQRSKRTKNLLPDYMRNVAEVAQAIKKEEEGKKGEGAKKPQTEEEEDAMFKARAQGYKASEKRLLEESLQRTFAGWTEADWKKFEEAYQQSL